MLCHFFTCGRRPWVCWCWALRRSWRHFKVRSAGGDKPLKTSVVVYIPAKMGLMSSSPGFHFTSLLSIWQGGLRVVATLSLLAVLQGCDDGPPRLVYVLQAPQSVELTASASNIRVKSGTPFVLHATRKTQGDWKQIPSRDLASDQCWMAAVPKAEEPEVADNVLWRVEPALGVQFNADFRPNRTREVTVVHPGTYTFRASNGVWCEPGRTVSAAPFQVTVDAP